MRIGILTDKLHSGSTPKIIGEEVRYLRELGHEAEAISIMEETLGGNQYQDFLKGLPLRFLSRESHPIFRALSFKFPFFSFFSTFHVLSPFFCTRVMRHKEYDAIVSHATYTCFTAKSLWKRRSIPYFAFIWDPISYILAKCYHDSLLRYALPALLPLGSKLDSFLVSDALAVILGSHFHMNLIRSKTKKPVEVVYPGCEPVESPPQKRGDYILAVDRWDIGNTPNKLLGMMKFLPHHARLLVEGFWHPPWLRDSFEKDVKIQGLEKQVRIAGPSNKEMLKKLYLGARVLVHPIEEAFGLASHEAAACGCPIIIPGTSGVAEIYRHDIHGFFPQEFNAEEYAEYAERLIADERLAWRMGYEAWQVARNYTWRNHSIWLNEVIMKYAK